MRRRYGFDLLVLECRRFQSGPGGQKRIPKNAEYPGTKIGAKLKSGKSAQRLRVCLLHKIFCLGRVLRKPMREIVELVEKRQSQFFESRGRQAAIRHLPSINGKLQDLFPGAEEIFVLRVPE